MIDKQDPRLGFGHGEQSKVVPPNALGSKNKLAPQELFGELFEPPVEGTTQSISNRDPLTSQFANSSVNYTTIESACEIDLAPVSPASLRQSGLCLMEVCDLILKQLHLQRGLLGIELAKSARLPFHLIDDGLMFLKEEKCIEVASGDLAGRISYRFNLTELGQIRVRRAILADRDERHVLPVI